MTCVGEGRACQSGGTEVSVIETFQNCLRIKFKALTLASPTPPQCYSLWPQDHCWFENCQGGVCEEIDAEASITVGIAVTFYLYFMKSLTCNALGKTDKWCFTIERLRSTAFCDPPTVSSHLLLTVEVGLLAIPLKKKKTYYGDIG